MNGRGVRLLDDDQLERLDRVLARQPGDLLLRLGGPSPVEEIRELFAKLPVTPTDEVVLWLARHEWNNLSALPGHEVFPAKLVADGYSTMRDVAAEIAEMSSRDPDDVWSPHWLMTFSLGGFAKLATDCSAAPDGPTPIRMVALDAVHEPGYAKAFVASLGEYIEDALTALESGRYRYDPGHDHWFPDDYALRPITEGFKRLL